MVYQILNFFLLIAVCGSWSQAHEPEWKFLENDHLKIGVDVTRGACIGWFSEKRTGRNLLNHYDEGRFLQQSYYGAPDGSRWEGRNVDWVYNPVQGGSWDRQPAELISLDLSSKGLKVVVRPRHWASAELLQNIIMSSDIELKGPIAMIRFKMIYTGPDQGSARHQEVPALFVDGALRKFHYTKNGKRVTAKPKVLEEGDGGQKEGLALGHSSSEWVAYTNEEDWGVGIYTPGTTEFTCYTARGDGSVGPTGSACSYVAPIRTFSLKPNLVFEYEAYLTIGSIDQINKRFEAIRSE